MGAGGDGVGWGRMELVGGGWSLELVTFIDIGCIVKIVTICYNLLQLSRKQQEQKLFVLKNYY